MFFHLGNHVENTLCNVWVKRFGIPIEYIMYSAQFGTNLMYFPQCAKYFVYSMGIPHLFTQNYIMYSQHGFQGGKTLENIVCFNDIKNNKFS